VLTLMQTHKIKPFPVVLYDGKYWNGFLDWLRKETLAREFVSDSDFDLLRVCDTPDEVIETVQKWYIKREIVGRRAIAE
jgi:predicted Rossmann-fold nucleotide-binding protein